MTDGERDSPVIEYNSDPVADFDFRTAVEAHRQDAMVAHNEKADIVLSYKFGGAGRVDDRSGRDRNVKRVSLRTAPAAENDLPRLVNYTSRFIASGAGSTPDALTRLMTEHGIASSLQPEFATAVSACAASFRLHAARRSLPDKPKRDYRAGEGVINYLRSDEGFGPWVAAGNGALTRPLIREKAPKAYTALANWLRNNALPDDLPIPTKSEALDGEALGEISVTLARRIARRGDRQNRG